MKSLAFRILVAATATLCLCVVSPGDDVGGVRLVAALFIGATAGLWPEKARP